MECPAAIVKACRQHCILRCLGTQLSLPTLRQQRAKAWATRGTVHPRYRKASKEPIKTWDPSLCFR